MTRDEGEENERICNIFLHLFREYERYKLQKLPDDILDYSSVELVTKQLLNAFKIKPNVADDDEKVWYLFGYIVFHCFVAFYDPKRDSFKDFNFRSLPIRDFEALFECTLNSNDEETLNAFFSAYQFLQCSEVEMFKEVFHMGIEFLKLRDKLTKNIPILPDLERYEVCERVPLSPEEHLIVKSWRNGTPIDFNQTNIEMMLIQWRFDPPSMMPPPETAIPLPDPRPSSSSSSSSQSNQVCNGFSSNQTDTEKFRNKKSVRFNESSSAKETNIDSSPSIALMQEIHKFINNFKSENGCDFHITSTDLNNMIVQSIQNKSDDALFDDLLNLLGDEMLEFISKIVSDYAPKILEELNNALVPKKNNKLTNKATEEVWKLMQNKKDSNKFQSITINTEKEKKLKKEMNKLNKTSRKLKNSLQNDDFETNSLTLEELEQMKQDNIQRSVMAAFEPKFGKVLPVQPQEAEKYPFVFDLLQEIRTSAAYIADVKLLLPEGFTRKTQDNYEEYSIPILSSSEETQNFLKQFKRLVISECDEFIQNGFKGFESLNLIQSTVFPTAYLQNNQNMLICAPTGAGKTNIAMLSILNILKAHSIDGTPAGVQNDNFKIIYIAPMKALCAEMADTFGKRLQPFGLKVCSSENLFSLRFFKLFLLFSGS